MSYSSLPKPTQLKRLLLEFEPYDRYGEKYVPQKRYWTPELAQDLEAYHSIDAEAELIALLSAEIAALINNE